MAMNTTGLALADVHLRRAIAAQRPRTPAQLLAWVRAVLGFDIPTRALMAGHDAPFDYLCHAFFEDVRPPAQRNALVWAARGTGKTQIGAIATLLDMLFKPGIAICILGGSFAQSSRMHSHLRTMLEDEALNHLVDGSITLTHVQLHNRSRVDVLGQSQTAVRGRRVHRLRCDEVELFDPDVWQAAQLVTRSGRCGGIDVRGSIEAFSTMHRPFGLMSQLVRDAGQCSTRVFRWNVIDVLEVCPPGRACNDCRLFAAGCGGLAKRATSRPRPGGAAPAVRIFSGGGFVSIDDAIDQSARVSPPAWQCEMLCERPDVSECVYPQFNEAVHLFDGDPRDMSASVTWLGGLDFGYRAPSVMLLAALDAAGVLHVLDETIERGWTTLRVIEHARHRCAALGIPSGKGGIAWFGADPAGLQRSEQSGVSAIALWRRAGFTVHTRATTIEAGIELVRCRLGAADGRVGLRIHRRCVQLIRAVREYHFDARRPSSTQPVKDGPDHAADALRYLIVNLDWSGLEREARVQGY